MGEDEPKRGKAGSHRDDMPNQFLEMRAARFATLADQTRLKIIHCLMNDGELNVTQIVETTGYTLSHVSKHLRQLRDAQIVVRMKEGLRVHYRLDDPLVEKFCKLVGESLLTHFESLGAADE